MLVPKIKISYIWEFGIWDFQVDRGVLGKTPSPPKKNPQQQNSIALRLIARLRRAMPGARVKKGAVLTPSALT